MSGPDPAGPRALSRRAEWLVTAGSLGHMRPASGTWGSLPPVAVAVWLLAWRDGLGWTGASWALVYLAVMLALLLLSGAACIAHGGAAEVHFRKKDPGQVVADEVAGMCLTLVPLAWLVERAGTAFSDQIMHGVLPAFLLFRVLDVAKIWPARSLQRVPAGWGILLDDLVSGLQAAGALWVLLAIWPPG